MEVKETSYRWVILTLYSLSLGANAMMWITAAPITTEISNVKETQTYSVNDFWVEMCSLVFMILYIPVVFPSNYILDTLGLRTGVTIIADHQWNGPYNNWLLNKNWSFWWLLVHSYWKLVCSFRTTVFVELPWQDCSYMIQAWNGKD